VHSVGSGRIVVVSRSESPDLSTYSAATVEPSSVHSCPDFRSKYASAYFILITVVYSRSSQGVKMESPDLGKQYLQLLDVPADAAGMTDNERQARSGYEFIHSLRFGGAAESVFVQHVMEVRRLVLFEGIPEEPWSATTKVCADQVCAVNNTTFQYDGNFITGKHFARNDLEDASGGASCRCH
jgi:hypothetical protein